MSTNRSVQRRWTHHQWQYQSNQFHQYEPQLSAEEKTIINLLWSYGQVMGSLLLYMIIFGGQSRRSNDYASLQFWVPCHRCILMYIHFETSFFKDSPHNTNIHDNDKVLSSPWGLINLKNENWCEILTQTWKPIWLKNASEGGGRRGEVGEGGVSKDLKR